MKQSFAQRYSDLPHLRKSIVNPPNRFLVTERHHGAGEVRRGRAARKDGAQARAELSEADALSLGESAQLALQAGHVP